MVVKFFFFLGGGRKVHLQRKSWLRLCSRVSDVDPVATLGPNLAGKQRAEQLENCHCRLFILNSSATSRNFREQFTADQFTTRAVFVRFSLRGQSFDWRLATIAGMEVAKLVPWNSLLN